MYTLDGQAFGLPTDLADSGLGFDPSFLLEMGATALVQTGQMGMQMAFQKKQAEKARKQERWLVEQKQAGQEDLMKLAAEIQQANVQSNTQVPPGYQQQGIPQPDPGPGQYTMDQQVDRMFDAERQAGAWATSQPQPQQQWSTFVQQYDTSAADEKKKDRLKKILLYTGLGVGGAAILGAALYFAVGRAPEEPEA